MAFLRHSILALRVLLWTLLTSLLVFAAATGFGIVQERQRALQAAHDSARNAVLQSLPTLSLSLWQYDTVGLQTLLRGIVLNSAVLSLEVFDQQQRVVEVRQSGPARTPDRVWSQTLLAPDGKSVIGTLRIAESYAEVEQQMAAELRTLVGAELIKIIGLAVILFVIVYRKIARHLHQLAEDVAHLDGSERAQQVSIRRYKLGGHHDELDVLVAAINRFLSDRDDEMRRRSQAEESLRLHIRETETTLKALSDAVLTLDRQCRIRYANPAACTLLQATDQALLACSLEASLMLADPASGSSLTELCQTVIADNQALVLRGQMLIRVANQDQFEARIHIVPAPDAGPVALIFVFTDISEELRKERQIAFQAFHDPLTNLGNRSLLARDLPIALARSQQQGNRLAVLCLDLDNFKNINDALGHATGDLLLLQLAERLRQLVPDPAWVTRHGGDEFIVVCPGLSALDTALALSQTLLSGIAQPFFIKGQVLRITSSIGISLFPDHAQEVGPLISHADLAMYEAKRHGKNAFWVYDKHLFQVSAARLSMENGLRTALQEREFSLAFQPKVTLSSQRVDGVEALLRWHSSHAGWVPPASFIGLAEETGLIIEIGAWVLQEALAAALRLRQQLGYNLAIAVNVSPVQFRSDALISTLRQMQGQTPDLSELIEIELTESALSGEIDEVVARLRDFKQLGLKIAIDDFGTGYSSLSYLKIFPIDILKIDQAFIRGLGRNATDLAIVGSVIQLANSLGFATVAEGVEEAAQLATLSELGCDCVQGYWFARPVAEADLVATIGALALRQAQPAAPA